MEENNERTQQDIHDKGFDIMTSRDVEFKKIKVGAKTLDDAVLDLGQLRHTFPLNACFNKAEILKAIGTRDLPKLREISNLFYKVSGIYERTCNYFATLYRYDWYTVPNIKDDEVKEEKVLKDFAKVLSYLDGSLIKKTCGDIALEVIKNGAYYGYIIESPKGVILQQLPIGYCRSRYQVAGMPVVEFNMSYFDTFKDIQYRLRVLNLFPDEFKKAYIQYKEGKMKTDMYNDTYGWYLLDPSKTVKFNFNNSDIPVFINAIPAIIDLDQALDLDRRKQMQKLLKIIVQKLPFDKNGNLIFDVDEARDIHNNAVEMLKRAIGLDVLTTFADIESIDLADKNTTTTTDDLAKVERTVYNAFGTSQNLFNTDGNLSLEKSILTDESNARNLLLQFEIFYNRIISKHYTNSKYGFVFYMLETTQFNYKELSKLYKEQTQIGYSKMLPQIALGHSQSFILNSVFFENNYLHLSSIMIPPLMSSTMSGEDLIGLNDKQVGRPEKADGEKSDKTIANKESAS